MADREEIKNQAANVINKLLREKSEEAVEDYAQKNGIKLLYINSLAISDKVVNSLEDSAVEEFMETYPKTTADTVNDDASEYINENYDRDFMTNQVEHNINEDEIRENMTDDLVLMVENTEPYGNLDNRSYWLNAANRVQNLGEMQSYINGNIAVFVERYASDWEEINDQD